jgi:hypothetical protein
MITRKVSWSNYRGNKEISQNQNETRLRVQTSYRSVLRRYQHFNKASVSGSRHLHTLQWWLNYAVFRWTEVLCVGSIKSLQSISCVNELLLPQSHKLSSTSPCSKHSTLIWACPQCKTVGNVNSVLLPFLTYSLLNTPNLHSQPTLPTHTPNPHSHSTLLIYTPNPHSHSTLLIYTPNPHS